MATKKKVATKTAIKKTAVLKKTLPVKKAAKPGTKNGSSHVLSKKPSKQGADIIKPPAARKIEAVDKPVHKTVSHKTVKPVLEKLVIKKAEPMKPSNKKEEAKQVDPKITQPSTPSPAKQTAKKETEPVKPAKLVMPEIKTKSVRKYEPDFTKSVLDTHMHDHSGPSQRYSDIDLGEFRELINKKLDAAKKELNYLQGLITRKDEMGGDESDNRYMTMEDGSISMEREQLSQMASRQITFIDHLEKALMRIENKTYGICRVTGKLIDKARLRAVPHATLSIEAKQTMNR